jgi:archaellum biogenesis protein FlaJ (TadC family)
VTQRDPLQREQFFKTINKYFRNQLKKNSFIENYWRDFQTVYMRSGTSTYLDDYIQRMKLITALSTMIFTVLGFQVLWLLLRWTLGNALLGAFANGLIFGSITGAVQIYYPYYRINESKTRLEDGLIYFLSYMTVLSASGMPIERILERITDVEDNPPLVHLTKKFIMNIKLFGMDVRTALKDIASMSPSKTFTKQIDAIRTTIATSGDLKTLLQYEVDRQLQVKREKLKAKINALVYIGEIYVALMVVTPTLFILIISILSILGASALGGSAVTQLSLIVFLGIPILGGIFIVLLDQTMGREE